MTNSAAFGKTVRFVERSDSEPNDAGVYGTLVVKMRNGPSSTMTLHCEVRMLGDDEVSDAPVIATMRSVSDPEKQSQRVLGVYPP